MKKSAIMGFLILIMFLVSLPTLMSGINTVKTSAENEDIESTGESYGFLILHQIVGWIQGNIVLFIAGIVLSVLVYAGFIKK